jgi:hypothetical protein
MMEDALDETIYTFGEDADLDPNRKRFSLLLRSVSLDTLNVVNDVDMF